VAAEFFGYGYHDDGLVGPHALTAQPGAGYGTTAQDYTAWYTALRAFFVSLLVSRAQGD
jgi:hypothetical protein